MAFAWAMAPVLKGVALAPLEKKMGRLAGRPEGRTTLMHSYDAPTKAKVSSRPQSGKMHVILADIHYPEHDARALKAVFEFLRGNKARIASVTLLGDALDCQDVSRHTEGKPRLRKRGGWRKDLDGFKRDILDRIEESIKPGTKLTYLSGNHEFWLQDLLDEQPELEGLLEIPILLDLEKRGWRWIPVGGHIERAGFVLLHGDQIGSGIHVAKKMVDSVNENCIMGHIHRYSAFSKSALVTERKKQLGTTLPCLCTVAPTYAKNQPNAFVHGFGILEEWAPNRANLYVPIIFDGRFSYGGTVYGRYAAAAEDLPTM